MGHAFYWLGDLLERLAPDINLGQPRATETPEYYAYVADLVAEIMISEKVNAGSIKNIKIATYARQANTLIQIFIFIRYL